MTDETNPIKPAEDENAVEILKDIAVPRRFYERIDLGVPVMNEIFGGQDMPGILPGAIYLFTGMPGAGKSTMALQLADIMNINAGKSVLYNAGEESKAMVKMRADRLRINGKFAISNFEEVDDLLLYAATNGVDIIYQDSLQSLRDGPLEGKERLKSIVKKFQAISKLDESKPITVFIIGHITKGGDFAGPMEIKHDVDAHAHLSLNKENGNRVFEILKNRFGPAAIPYEFSMNANGVDFTQISAAPPPGEEGSETPGGATRAAERREKIKELIKEKILAGERVSGYCFTRYGVDCSGGFWRGMLAKACQELQNEGHRIGEERINGRIHNYLEV